MDFEIPEEKIRQYEVDGYFILESIIPDADLQLLRSECQSAVDEIDAEMDLKGTDVLGINHRGKRYFCGQSYRTHPRLGSFIFSDLMASICRATIGDNAYFHNDQYVVKSGKTGMKFSWHQDSAYVQARIGDHPEHLTMLMKKTERHISYPSVDTASENWQNILKMKKPTTVSAILVMIPANL